MSLFKMSNQYNELMQKIEDNPDLDPKLVEDTIASIEESMAEKYDNIWTFIKDLEAQVKLREEYIAAKRKEVKSYKAKIDSLKRYAIQEMNAINKKKIRTEHYTLSIRNSHCVAIKDESLIPKEFLEVQAPKIKKKEITKAFKNGKDVPGAEYVDSQSLLGR